MPLKTNSLARLFVSGAFWSFSGKVLSAAATLVVNALLARLLSPEDMGAYFLVFSFVTILAICGQWGLNRGLVKLIASEMAKGYSAIARKSILASFVIVISICLSIIAVLHTPSGTWILTKLSGSDVLVPVSFLIGLWILFKALLGLISESFRGFHDIRMATMFGGFASAILSALFVFVFWLNNKSANLEQMLELTVFAIGISLSIGLLSIYRKLRTLDRGGEVEIFKVLNFGFPLFLTSVTLFAVREFHILILAMYQPETEVALYGSASRLIALLTMPLIIVNSVIPPMIADLYSQEKYLRVQNVLQKTATLMAIIAVIVSAVIFIFGADILGLVYGDPYREAFTVFAILTAGQLLNVLTGSPGVLLTMSGHEKFVMKSALTTGIIGVIVSIVGVQAMGAVGAAIGYSVGIVLVNVAMWFYSYKKLSIRTHGSLNSIMPIVKKGRAKIESDGANSGKLAVFDCILRLCEDIWWKVRGYKVIECFGDSHVSVFRG